MFVQQLKREMKTAHTQGEWLLNKDYSVSSSKLYNRVMIAQICSADNNDEEKAANAKLICAAPELLEALEIAIQWIPKDLQKHFKQIIKKASK